MQQIFSGESFVESGLMLRLPRCFISVPHDTTFDGEMARSAFDSATSKSPGTGRDILIELGSTARVFLAYCKSIQSRNDPLLPKNRTQKVYH
jgi:hypothetical protein